MKVAGFTILELIVVLLISTITLSIAYTSLGITEKMAQKLKTVYSSQDSVLVLMDIIKEDINRADIVLRNGDGFSCKTVKATVDYIFIEDLVLRMNGGIADTIANNFPLSFFLINKTKNINLLEGVKFEVLSGEDTLRFSIEKVYDAKTYIENNGAF